MERSDNFPGSLGPERYVVDSVLPESLKKRYIIKESVTLILFIALCMNIAIAQDFDYDIYPPDSLSGKGILLNVNIKEEAFYDDQWWLSEGAFSINAEMEGLNVTFHFDKEHPNGYSSITRDYILDIPAGPFRVCGQDETYYHISMSYPKQRAILVREFAFAKYFRVRKSEMDSLGFRFLPCEELVAFYKTIRITDNPVGTHIYPPLQVNSPEPNTMQDGSYSAPYPYFVFSVLRSEPLLSAPFISIIEPCPQGYGPGGVYQCSMVSKKDYWYELQLEFKFMFGGVFWDAFYQGGTYTGYWQAPFDQSGFPYALIDMVYDNRQWPLIIQQLREKGKL